MVKKLKNYINGEWVDSKTNEWLDVENPATGEILAQVPMSTTEELNEAFEVAQEAFIEWRETPALNRQRNIFKLRELMEENFEKIARTITIEMGKTLSEARGEARRAIECLEVAAGMTRLMMGYNLEDIARNIDCVAIRQPLGVFACIPPFNFPAMVPFWFFPFAVTAGNTYIVKPSEQVPMTQQFIFELIDEAGFPEGVMNLVNGGRNIAEGICNHPKLQGLSSVTSTSTAKILYATVSKNGKRAQCLAGAKNFMHIMPDCNIEQTVQTCMTSFYGCAGQRCLSGSVALVHQDIYDVVVKAFVEATKTQKVGNGMDESVNIGPVISKQAKDKIEAMITRAEKAGAKILVDGRDLKVPGLEKGHFVGPTILANITPDMEMAQEEDFGPTMSIIKVKNLDEGLKIAHANRYGNSAAIFTSSGKTARDFRYRAGASMIGINIGIVAPMAFFPFGGYKDSMFGDLKGHGIEDAIRFFTDTKVVIERWF